MQIIIEKDLANFHAFSRVPDRLIGPHFNEEMYRGVRDAGKKRLTVVCKAAVKQVAPNPGKYSFMVANTQDISRKADLRRSIRSRHRGLLIRNDKRLKVTFIVRKSDLFIAMSQKLTWRVKRKSALGDGYPRGGGK